MPLTLAVDVRWVLGSMASTEARMSKSGRWPATSQLGSHFAWGWMKRALPVVARSTCTASVTPTSGFWYLVSDGLDTSSVLCSGLNCALVKSHEPTDRSGSVATSPPLELPGLMKLTRLADTSRILTASSVRRMQSPFASP